MVDNTKLESLAFRLKDLESLRRLFAELNYEFADEPVYKKDWNQSLKDTVVDSRIIAKKHDFLIYYIKTESNSIRDWKNVATKIITSNNGFCLVCSHNPAGFQWIFSSLSKEFSKSFSESRHIPIDINPNLGIPKPFLEFLESIKIEDSDKGVTILGKISDTFDKFSLQIHDELTVNVFQALKTLSEGIIGDKNNNLEPNVETLEKIRESTFILLYRIIFVLYAEDRGIFPVENKTYHEQFSLKWIKQQWILRSKNQQQLREYEIQNRLKQLFRLIEVGSEELEFDPKEFFMRSYYGRLFDRKINSQLEKWNIPNKFYLEIIELLTSTTDNKGNRFFLDYAALETRHLGAIYEHLLDFHLIITNNKIADLPNPNERKASGSFYTPKEIVDYIVTNSIEPLISEIIKNNQSKEVQLEKILSIKILDPAMGSGHFLVGVVEYLAKRLCEIEFGQVNELQYIEKKRDVVRHCIYGVDKNPLAVDLAKLSLWLETLSSDKPLTFLSAHLKHGNSLIGESMTSIYDAQQTLFETQSVTHFKKTVQEFLGFESLEDDTPSAVKAKLEKYEKMQARGTMYHQLRGLLDYKTAEYFGKKLEPWKDLRQKIGVESIDFYSSDSGKSVSELRKEQNFFNWELEFPEIFFDEMGEAKKNPGFDVVIGNPPWDIIEPDIDEFYGQFYNKKDLTRFSQLKLVEKNEIIKKLSENQNIVNAWKKYNDNLDLQREYFRKSKKYGLQSAKTIAPQNKIRPNLYKLFIEKFYFLLKKGGCAGIVIPANFYTNIGSKGLRQLIFNETEIISLLSFENRNKIFDIHRQIKFISLIFKKGGNTKKFNAAFKLDNVNELNSIEKNLITYNIDLIKKASPDIFALIETKTQTDVDIITKLLKFPLLLEQSSWKIRFQREFNKTDDARFFNSKGIGAPLYGGRMIHQFTHQYAKPQLWVETKKGRDFLTVLQGKRVTKIIKKQLKNKTKIKLPKIKIDFDYYRLGWRDVTNETDKRTLICTILPPHVFMVETIPYLRPNYFNGKNFESTLPADAMLFICGLFNSFVIDYFLRQRISLHATMAAVYEIPIPTYGKNDLYFSEIVERVGSLICTTKEYDELRKELKIKHISIAPNERQILISQIDAYVAKIYDITRNEFEYILNTFPIVDDKIKQQTLSEYDKLS